MKKSKNNEKGLTLVEVLAVIVIGALIIILISNTHLFGQKQYKNQSGKAEGLYDISYALKVITKEIRKSETPIWLSDTEFSLDDVIYKFDKANESITSNGSVLVKDITDFEIEETNPNSKWKISIVNKSNKKVETQIVIKRGI
ncbi:PilW family protein [Sporosarcina sp. CAU 1771]